MDTSPNAVECEGLSKHFVAGGRSFVALENVDLAIPHGQFLAVTGPSGSGKSTLLNLIGGLDRPSGGEVRIDGKGLSQLEDAPLARLRNSRLGFVFQQFQLLARYDVSRNVELPLKYAGLPGPLRASRARELLVRFGLEQHAKKFPPELSGGQQQRVAIARALANRPAIVLADEPTGALDSVTGGEVVALLRELCSDAGITVVMVTHDLDLARQADRIVRFADGRLIGDNAMKAPSHAFGAGRSPGAGG